MRTRSAAKRSRTSIYCETVPASLVQSVASGAFRWTARTVKGPEYETCGFFGPNIDAISMENMLRLNYQCDLLGMDTISLASTMRLPWELKENGVADFDVSFGNSDNLP
jgi:aldehyde:ferredoxin oxidoreductase